MALQRDFETLKEKNDGEKQPVCTNPLSVLKVVMKQCKNMQERMLSQLAAAESRHRKVGSPSWPVPHKLLGRLDKSYQILSCQLPVSTVSQLGGLPGVKSPTAYPGAKRSERKHKLFKMLNLGRMPDTLLKTAFLLDMTLQNTGYVFSALDRPDFGNKLGSDQACRWTECSLFAYLSDK